MNTLCDAQELPLPVQKEGINFKSYPNSSWTTW